MAKSKQAIQEENQSRRYEEIPLKSISVSQTTPQAIRRLGFTDENLAEITESIKKNGVLEPILVRPVGTGKGFEIAAGERRFLGAKKAGLKEIPAMIKVLTDEEVDDIQLHENLHREEPHPLEEAATYEYMEKERGIALEEIATRAAKSVRYVAGRKELLKLAEKPREMFRRNELTLSHALEIAKYPAGDQGEILSYAFSNFGHTSQALFPLPKFIEAIKTHYLLRLDKAPFSKKAENLGTIPCTECPQRTGANPTLFGDDNKKDDSCLNRKCYELKVKKQIQLTREAIAVETKNAPPEKAEKIAQTVPLIVDSYWLNNEKKKELGEKVITKDEYKILSSFECGKAEYAVFADGNRKGQKEIICKESSKCCKHWSSSNARLPKEEKSEEILDAESLERKNRKEEIIDVNVGETVRRRILGDSSRKFDSANTIFNHANADDYIYQLTAKLWKFQCHYSNSDAEIIRETLGASRQRLPASYIYDNAIAELTADERARLLFLILHVSIEKMTEGGSYVPQAKIKKIAAEFGLDYQMIDAIERLKYAQAKHEKYAKEFHNYLVKIENGDLSAKIPRVYSPDYKQEENTDEA